MRTIVAPVTAFVTFQPAIVQILKRRKNVGAFFDVHEAKVSVELIDDVRLNLLLTLPCLL